MNVILLERIEKLGQMGDVVNVKPGYARNYLLPQRKALRATEANVEAFESQRAQLEAANLEQRTEAEAVAKKMDGLTVVLIRQAGESGQLYGSVTARDIAGAVTQQGFTIDRRQVLLERPIKTLGLHDSRIALHPEVNVVITTNIAQSADEAVAQVERARKGLEPVAARDTGAEPEASEEEADESAAAEVFETTESPESTEIAEK